MTMSVFTNLYFSIAVLSFIALVDVLIKFKNTGWIKFFFLLLPFSTGVVALINSFNWVQFVFFLPFFKTSIAISWLNIFSLLYFPKFKKWTLFFSTLMILMILLLAMINKNLFPNNHFLNQFKFVSIDSNLNIQITPSLRIVRLSFLTIFISHLIYFWYVITRKLNLNNIYYEKIKIWTSFIFTLSIIVIVSNIAIAFTKDRTYWANCLTIFLSYYLIVLILKRPTFLNTSAKKIAFGHKFNLDEEIEIDELIFLAVFQDQKYYAKKDASIEGLALLLKANPSSLVSFIAKKYDMSFSDLVNKNRVNYFFEIVQNPNYQNFTIDALAREVGFSSRQHLTKPFKKFHGGNPSDLLGTNFNSI